MSFCVAGARDCAPCQKSAEHQGFVTVSSRTTTTLHSLQLQLQLQPQLQVSLRQQLQSITTQLLYITLHQSHYTTLHYTSLHSSTSYYTTTPLQLRLQHATTTTTATTATATTLSTLHYTTLHHTSANPLFQLITPGVIIKTSWGVNFWDFSIFSFWFSIRPIEK